MKKIFRVLSATILLIPSISLSQTTISTGVRHAIQSAVFHTQRELQIYVPDGYETSDKSYPVLYLLDGQRWYFQAVSYQRLFQEYSYTPDFIVVGINTNDSGRYGFFQNSEKLTEFLSKDIIPYVETNFRTANERLIFGWQFAGAFVVRSLLSKPELFSGHIAASPIPINGSLLENLTSDLSDNSLFIATSHVENQVNIGVDDFVGKLENRTTSLKWKYLLTEFEDISSFGHRTTPLSALYHGLRFYFSDYPFLEFDNVDDFYALGGFGYVQSYYENRANKYGLSNDIPQEGMFFLLRLGLNENEYSVFKTFMTEFIENGVVNRVNMGWGMRYAEFSLQNDDYEMAESILEILMTRFPDNARPVNGMGKVQLAQGNRRDARKFFKSAVDLAEKNNDRRLEQYQADLDELKR